MVNSSFISSVVSPGFGIIYIVIYGFLGNLDIIRFYDLNFCVSNFPVSVPNPLLQPAQGTSGEAG
jgi:hypothetical protein